MKPRLRAEWVVFEEIFCSLASCCLSSIKINSVFEEFRLKRLELRSHARRDSLQSAMEICYARMRIGRMKGKEKLCIIGVQMAI